jgi:hypothetical protein
VSRGSVRTRSPRSQMPFTPESLHLRKAL